MGCTSLRSPFLLKVPPQFPEVSQSVTGNFETFTGDAIVQTRDLQSARHDCSVKHWRLLNRFLSHCTILKPSLTTTTDWKYPRENHQYIKTSGLNLFIVPIFPPSLASPLCPLHHGCSHPNFREIPGPPLRFSPSSAFTVGTPK